MMILFLTLGVTDSPKVAKPKEDLDTIIQEKDYYKNQFKVNVDLNIYKYAQPRDTMKSK